MAGRQGTGEERERRERHGREEIGREVEKEGESVQEQVAVYRKRETK